MSVIDKFIQFMTGGFFSIGSMVKVSAAGVITERDKYFTQQGVSRVYQINQMKPIYDYDLISSISNAINKIDNQIIIKTYYEVMNTTISLNTPMYTRQMNRQIQEYLEVKSLFESLPKEVQESGVYSDNGVNRWSFTKTDVLKKKHKYDSYVDVNNHIRNDRGVYFLVALFITVVYPNLDICKALDSQIETIIKKEVSNVTSIDKNIASFLMCFSPSTQNTTGMKANTLLVSEQNLTQLMPFRREGILSQHGIPLGTNIKNTTPFWINPYASPEGAATVIAAKAGKGKSTLAFTYATNLVGANHTLVYIDLKGTEVTKCLSAVMDSVITIDFSEQSSKFVNTMHLSKFVPNYTLEDAIKTTSEMLSIFVNINPNTEGNPSDVILILKHALRSYYNEIGVVSGVLETYYLSESMTYLGIIPYIGKQQEADDENHLKLLYEIIPDRLAEAFVEFNMKTNDTAISLDDLFGYSIIVFSFNKNDDVQVSLVDNVRIYMALMVTKRIAKYNRANDLFTDLICEEAQRYLSFENLCIGISDLASGSRSDNVSVIVILNNLAVLTSKSLGSLKSNLQNFIIGACDDDAVRILIDVFNKKILANDVKKIIESPKKYERVFAVHFEAGSEQVNALVRCDIPQEIANAFGTRTILDKEIDI